jgi:hypothetical protein
MYAGTQPWTPSVLDVGHDDYFRAGIAGCLDLASSSYLGGAPPTTSTTTSTTSSTTTSTTATTTVQPLRATVVSVTIAGHGKKRVLSVRLEVSDTASVRIVLTGGGRTEGAKTFAVRAGDLDLALAIGSASAGSARLKITVTGANRQTVKLAASVVVPA